MSRRPPSRLAALGTADRLLVGGTLLLFIDSLLDWQPGLNAWGGSAAFAGVLMALLALLLLVGELLAAFRVAMPAGLPVYTVMAGLTAEVPAGLSKVKVVPMTWLGLAGLTERFASQSWFCSSLQLLGIMLTTLSMSGTVSPSPRRECGRAAPRARVAGCPRSRQ